jgi:hypothetical protein
MSFSSFSQTVTDSLKIQLSKPVARLVIKDLLKGDGFGKELKLTLDKVNLLESKIILKDSIIFKQSSKLENFENILSTQKSQLILSQELTQKLQIDLKKQKIKTKVYQLGSGIAIVGIITIALLK